MDYLSLFIRQALPIFIKNNFIQVGGTLVSILNLYSSVMKYPLWLLSDAARLVSWRCLWMQLRWAATSRRKAIGCNTRCLLFLFSNTQSKLWVSDILFPATVDNTFCILLAKLYWTQIIMVNNSKKKGILRHLEWRSRREANHLFILVNYRLFPRNAS